MGLNSDFYESVRLLYDSESFLAALNDLTVHPQASTLLSHTAVKSTLLRGTELRFEEKLALSEGFTLEVDAQLAGFEGRHQLDVQFSGEEIRRLAVLIGENGAGKTQLLSAIAKKYSDWNSEIGEVARVVALSYSIFDMFRYQSWTT